MIQKERQENRPMKAVVKALTCANMQEFEDDPLLQIDNVDEKDLKELLGKRTLSQSSGNNEDEQV